MICERGGCCGRSGPEPHPAYGLLLLFVVLVVLLGLHELPMLLG